METKPIADLRPDPENARAVTPGAQAGLRTSMEQFGDLSGIVFNLRSQELVCGHQRVDQLRASGAVEWVREGEAAWLQHPKTGERFPIRLVDWDPTQQRMANLVANNPEIQGTFTASAIDQLRAVDDDARFQSLVLDELLASLVDDAKRAAQTAQRGGSTDRDDAPSLRPDAVSKLGDLYHLGNHRLLCGDSTKPDDVARVMGSDKAGLMNTDPPYGIAYTDEARVAADRAHVRQQRETKWAGGIENDELTRGPELQAFLEKQIRASLPHLAPHCAFYLWHPMLTQGTFFAAAAAADILIHRQIIWVKPSLLFGFGDYHWRHELCFYGWIRGKRPEFFGARNQTSVWEITHDTSNGNRNHPTQKPVELFTVPMENHLRPGEVAFEPFSGSGSQIIAGEVTGRRVRAIELDPRYVDVAVARWEAFTGQRAELIGRAP